MKLCRRVCPKPLGEKNLKKTKKSTWTAFLRVMFYGLSTKDRSPNADKRRYQPWSGSA